MGKKDRLTTRPAFVTLRDLPGTRVMFWVVGECPYCGERHLHPAGNLRTADPGERLGEVPAPCNPERLYDLQLPPQTAAQKGQGGAEKGAAQGPSGGWVGCGVRG
ncbi:hypothetical protein [Deinococcus radiodurans]|uniref:hypothetical protein n=1 Tax=Deinococcus radiodurans TaxID=1299 RepID=UPI003211C236